MSSTEMVELPKDCEGQTLRLPYEVLLGESMSLTLLLLSPYIWYRAYSLALSAASVRTNSRESK